jgi:hypothetical protein
LQSTYRRLTIGDAIFKRIDLLQEQFYQPDIERWEVGNEEAAVAPVNCGKWGDLALWAGTSNVAKD